MEDLEIIDFNKVTNAEKLREIFGQNFSIQSHPVMIGDTQVKTYTILDNNLDQKRIEQWLDEEYKGVNS